MEERGLVDLKDYDSDEEINIRSTADIRFSNERKEAAHYEQLPTTKHNIISQRDIFSYNK